MIARKAFSLVEMLVAVLLITMLIGVAIFAFRYQLIAIHKTKKVGINKVITYNQIKTTLESMKYYVVDDYDMLNKPMKNLHFFFSATNKEINYISQNPLFSKEVALARLKCIDSKLIYKEQRLYGTMDFLRPEFSELAKEMVFYKDLDRCDFRFVLPSLKEVITLKHTLPSAIIIDLSSNKIEHQIFISKKNDYNNTVYRVYDALYGED